MYKKMCVYVYVCMYTVSICKLFPKQIKHGKNTNLLSTTCLTKHLTSHHSSPLVIAPESQTKGMQFCSPSFIIFQVYTVISHDLSAASSYRDDGIAKGITGPCNTSATSTPPVVEYSRQKFLPQLLQRKQKNPLPATHMPRI